VIKKKKKKSDKEEEEESTPENEGKEVGPRRCTSRCAYGGNLGQKKRGPKLSEKQEVFGPIQQRRERPTSGAATAIFLAATSALVASGS